MHGEFTFLLDISIVLVISLIGGYISKRLHYPPVLGQIIGGIIIGPSLLSIIEPSEFVSNIAQIGVIFLMFLAGIETDFNELKKNAKKSIFIAVGGIVVPFLFGMLAIFIAKDDFTMKEMIFTGTVLTATSIGLTVQTLGDVGLLKTKVGTSVLGAAVLDDILGVIILSIVLGVFGTTVTSINVLIIKIILYFVLAIYIGRIIIQFVGKNKHLLKKVSSRVMQIITISAIFAFAIITEEFGVAVIIGAYVIGLIISMTSLKEKLEHNISTFGNSFFIPVFFVNIGLSVDLSGIGNYLIIGLIIMIAGISSKIIGSGFMARLAGFNKNESINIGISMVPRAEVALIIATLGLNTGMIGIDIFAGIILLVVGSTIITPLLLKIRTKNNAQSEEIKNGKSL